VAVVVVVPMLMVLLVEFLEEVQSASSTPVRFANSHLHIRENIRVIPVQPRAPQPVALPLPPFILVLRVVPSPEHIAIPAHLPHQPALVPGHTTAYLNSVGPPPAKPAAPDGRMTLWQKIALKAQPV
jgi:hypothetical protein